MHTQIKIKQKWRKIGTFLRFKGCYDQLKEVFSTYYPTLGMINGVMNSVTIWAPESRFATIAY